MEDKGAKGKLYLQDLLYKLLKPGGGWLAAFKCFNVKFSRGNAGGMCVCVCVQKIDVLP